MAESGGFLDSLVSSDSGGGAAGYGSGLIGGILDAAIGPVMSNVNYIRSKRVSNRQMGAAQWMAENQPSWAMRGLVNAGLNPILAATKGPGSPEFAPSARGGDPVSGGMSAALERGVGSVKTLSLLKNQAKILQNQERSTRNEADASEFATRKVNAEIGEILSRQGLYDEQMSNTASQSELNRATSVLQRTRNTVERLGIPWSEEQKRWAKDSPVGEISRLIKGVVSGAYEGSGAGQGVRDLQEWRDAVIERRKRGGFYDE